MARALANGLRSSTSVFEDEGRGFSNWENDIKARTAIVEFLVKYLRLWRAGDLAACGESSRVHSSAGLRGAS